MGVIKKLLKVIGVVFLLALVTLAVLLQHTSDCEPIGDGKLSGTGISAITYNCYGDPSVLTFSQIEKPAPEADEVLVRVKAASVNPMDWHYMRGSPYVMRLSSGLGAPDETRFGADYAGTVEAVGANVTKFKVGDNVFGGRTGAFAEYVKVPENRAIAKIPANVSFEQAAAIPIAAVSALQAIRDSGELQAGQKVLINGASGGVGTFAVQIAKSMGAEVTGVCSTRNVEMVKGLGADHIVNYKEEDFVQGDARYDVIIDNVGNRSISEYRSVLKPEGILVMVGGPSGNWIGPFKNAFSALATDPFVDQKLKMFLATLDPEDLEYLAELMESGKMTSVIDRRYSLEEVPEAIRYSESGRARGKIIINL